MRIRSLFKKVATIIRDEGFFSLMVRARRRFIRSRASGSPSFGIVGMLKKIDVIGFYDFVLTPNAGCLTTGDALQPDCKTVNWLIPDFGIGSGGHLNIFRYIQMLELRGYKNTICLVGDHRHSSPEQARALICEHFFELNAEVVFKVDDLPAAYFSFATGWNTAYALLGFGLTRHKLYFVQDFEPAFYATGSEYDFAEQTYKMGFIGICAGDWLSQKLSKDYGMTCYSLGFSFDRELYHQTPRRDPAVQRVFCYCRPPTIRRGLETAMLALDLVGQKMPSVKFIFAGWDMGDYRFPHEHLNAGVLSLKELPDLYSQCDVGLVISFTNLSLLPLELMSCGCVVVSNRGANTEWLLNDNNSVLTESAPASIAEGIVDILTHQTRKSNLVEKAKEFCSSTSWENEGIKLAMVLEDMRESDSSSITERLPLNRKIAIL